MTGAPQTGAPQRPAPTNGRDSNGMRVFRFVSFLLFAGFAAVLGVESLQLAGVARTYPTVFIVAVFFGTLFMALRELLARAQPVPVSPEVARLLRLPGWSVLRLLVFTAVWLTYPVLMEATGFIFSTTIGVSVSLGVLGLKRIALGMVGAALFSVCFAVLFATIFYIPTPSGILDDGVTHLLYLITH